MTKRKVWVDIREECEGCGEPVTHMDSEGVPLCKKCWEELKEELKGECEKAWAAKPASTLLEAEALVNGERAAAYGPWEDNAHNAAKIFCGMTGIVLTADDVTKLLIALKWARDRTNPKRDNVTDANGYGELLQKMREGRP